MSALKEEVRRLADDLPEDATWEDVLERIYLRNVIDQGVRAGREGRQFTIEEVRKHFGLG